MMRGPTVLYTSYANEETEKLDNEFHFHMLLVNYLSEVYSRHAWSLFGANMVKATIR